MLWSCHPRVSLVSLCPAPPHLGELYLPLSAFFLQNPQGINCQCLSNYISISVFAFLILLTCFVTPCHNFHSKTESRSRSYSKLVLDHGQLNLWAEDYTLHDPDYNCKSLILTYFFTPIMCLSRKCMSYIPLNVTHHP